MSVFKVYLSEDGRVTRTEQEGAIFSRSNLVNTLRVYSPYPSDYLIRAGFKRSDGVKVHSVFLFYVGQHEGYSLYEYNLTGDQVGSHGALAVALNIYKANQDALLTTATFTIQVGTSFEPLVEPEPVDDDNYTQLIDEALTRFQAAIDIGNKEIDAKPTVGSQNLVTSGGVKSAIDDVGLSVEQALHRIDTLGVANKIAMHKVVSSATLSVRTTSEDLFTLNLAELPINSIDEIVSFDVQYKFANKAFYETLHFNRETTGEYRRFVGSGQSIALTASELTNLGQTIGSNTTLVQCQIDIPPIEFRVMTELESNGVIPVRMRFTRPSASIVIGRTSSGSVDSSLPSAPTMTQTAGLHLITYTRIDLNYLSSSIVSENTEPTGMTTYSFYFESDGSYGYIQLTAPVGLNDEHALQAWLWDCGYTSAENGCPIGELDVNGVPYDNAVIFAGTDGLYIKHEDYEEERKLVDISDFMEQ